MYSRYYENVTEAVAVNDREVEFRFDQKGNRELPKILGDMVVLPKHWWEGADASGKKRDITQPTLEPPLGSAAYKIESFKPGTEIVWARVPDYWGAKLPVKIGRENFDKRRYVYIQDDNAAWQAFTKGGIEDIQAEIEFAPLGDLVQFPGVRGWRRHQEGVPGDGRANMQGFIMNMRRPLFQDRKVRQALTYPIDFETMNRTIFFGFNTRVNSYFVGSELASSGLPQGKELEILEPVQGPAAAGIVHAGIQTAGLQQPPPRRATRQPHRQSAAAERAILRQGSPVRRGRLEDPERQDDQRKDRPAVHDRDSRQRRDGRGHRQSLHQHAAARSASRRRCASSTPANTSTASTTSTSTC